jgi:uncharacterized protein (TIGR02597 family)
MNIPQKTLSLLAIASLSTLSNLSAVETDPVGYITKTVNSNADLKLGLPLHQPPVLSSTVESVTTSTVTVAATVPDVTTDAHYLWVKSGPLVGKWYTITSATSNSATVAEDLATEGLVATNTIEIIPFWTLDTLLPSGGGVPKSSSVFSASAQVQLSNLDGNGINIATGDSYLYSDGSDSGLGISEGWVNTNNPFGGNTGSVIVSPASYITIRNETGSPADILNVGSVPTGNVANYVLSSSSGEQDSQITNPFPAGISLANSGLNSDGVIRASSNAFAPLDQLQVYPSSPSTINPAVSNTYIYSDGSQSGIGIPAGWLDINNPFGGSKDGDLIPAGAAIIVRRASGTDELISWSPSIPYTLD